MRFSARAGLAVAASLLMHGSVVLVLNRLPAARVLIPHAAVEAPWVEILLQTKPATARAPSNQPLGETPLLPGGPESSGTVDFERSGRGEYQRKEHGSLLAALPASLTLQDSDLNNLQVNQSQRIHTAEKRATQEQRRASPHAASEVFLASGKTGHEERRPAQKRDAATGAPEIRAPASALGKAEETLAPGDTVRHEPVETGAERPSVARGILRGTGTRNSDSAKVAFGRPNVDPGPAATTAAAIDARVNDDMDAELLAARMQRSLVDTSVQRSAHNGLGNGASAAPDKGIGAHGDGRGAKALPYLPGPGTFGALDTSDARYLRWFLSQRDRVQHELVFPRLRALAKDQGTCVYRVEVKRDGSLRGAPKLVRSSGFSDFDAAAIAAIERAIPFEPLPAALAPDLDRLQLLIPITFSNPMVQ